MFERISMVLMRFLRCFTDFYERLSGIYVLWNFVGFLTKCYGFAGFTLYVLNQAFRG